MVDKAQEFFDNRRIQVADDTSGRKYAILYAFGCPLVATYLLEGPELDNPVDKEAAKNDAEKKWLTALQKMYGKNNKNNKNKNEKLS